MLLWAHQITGDPPVIESTTRMLFQQGTAPTGWTRDETNSLDNLGLRIYANDTFVDTGGSVAWDDALKIQSVAGTIADTETGGTGYTGFSGTGSTGGSTAAPTAHAHVQTTGFNQSFGNFNGPPHFTGFVLTQISNISTQNGGGTGATHDHTGPSHRHTGPSHVHTSGAFSGTAIDMDLKFAGVIIATKD